MQAHGWGEWWTWSPIGSCQELSEDRIQTLGQERPGQPAVTSLTLPETIHLAERGPPRVERNLSDPRLNAHESTNAHTLADIFHVHRDTWTYIHAPLYAFTIVHARAILSNHHHNLWCCPHESFPYRQIRETEVTCCHKAEQTQINNLAVALAFTYSKSLSHRLSFNSCFFPHIPLHHYGVHKKSSAGTNIWISGKLPLLQIKTCNSNRSTAPC